MIIANQVAEQPGLPRWQALSDLPSHRSSEPLTSPCREQATGKGRGARGRAQSGPEGAASPQASALNITPPPSSPQCPPLVYTCGHTGKQEVSGAALRGRARPTQLQCWSLACHAPQPHRGQPCEAAAPGPHPPSLWPEVGTHRDLWKRQQARLAGRGLKENNGKPETWRMKEGATAALWEWHRA